MSWTVDGRTYHDSTEYQAALQRKSAREASDRAGQAHAEVQRYAQRLREQQAELDAARGDLARQQRVNEQMHQDVRGLRREQHQLAEIQQRFEQESNARLQEVRANLAGVGTRLAAAQREHERHVAETRRAFAQTEQALKSGLAEAEQRRRETDQRLTAAVQEVERKIELDRQQRLQRQQSALDEAREQIAMVEEVLAQVQPELKPLNLEGDDHSVRAGLQQARIMHQQGRASPALAQASGAFAEARTLVYNSQKRRAEMSAASAGIADRVQAVRQLTDSGQLDKYFKAEKAELLSQLDRVAGRLPQRYQQYSRMEDDLREDERILGAQEEQVRAMIAMCSTIADQIADRKERVTTLVNMIAGLYGGGADVKPRLAVADDPKSNLIVDCTFSGGETARIDADLDSRIAINAVGHSTQSDCEERMNGVLKLLQGQISVERHHAHAGNPSELPARTAARPRAWEDIRTRLSDIGRQL